MYTASITGAVYSFINNSIMNINWTDVKTFFINQNEVTKIQLNGTTLWQKSSGPTPVYTEPFYIEDISNYSFNVSIIKSSSSAPDLTIEYSTDAVTWFTLGTTSTTALIVQVPANGKIYLRCSTNAWATSSGYNKIVGDGTFFGIGGNIMSLLYGSSFTGNETTFPSNSTYNFYRLFYNSTYLQIASNLVLPATNLASYCYNNMFYGCNSLTIPPTSIPATTLAERCCQGMFQGCSALTTAPELPATTLADFCYGNMFTQCILLTTAPALPATTLASYCYSNMFSRCTHLTTPPELPATNLASYCYNDMFWNCTSLTTAPALPATNLVDNCYQWMFENCSNLSYVKCLATNISANKCTYLWLTGVSSTGTFVKDANMSSWGTGASGIPTGWTVQDAS